MERFRLTCDRDHQFEAWVENTSALVTQIRTQKVQCPFCTSHHIVQWVGGPHRKGAALKRFQATLSQLNAVSISSAPPLQWGALTSGSATENVLAPLNMALFDGGGGIPRGLLLALPQKLIELHDPTPSEIRQHLKELKRNLRGTCEDVGTSFAEEARKMHYKETRQRPIYGCVSLDEILNLKREGIHIQALPPLPKDDA